MAGVREKPARARSVGGAVAPPCRGTTREQELKDRQSEDSSPMGED